MKPLTKTLIFLLALAILTPRLPAQPPAKTVAVEKQADGFIIPLGGMYLKLQVRAANIIRVEASPHRAFFAQPSFTVVASKTLAQTPWHLVRAPGRITLVTASVQARVDMATGAVSFWDAAGQPILVEKPGARRLQPAQVQGQTTLHVQQEWMPNPDESLYGLGQRQLGLMDIKGYDLDLWQHNTNVVVPFLVSSRGYGILWDNPSYSRFGDLRPARRRCPQARLTQR